MITNLPFSSVTFAKLKVIKHFNFNFSKPLVSTITSNCWISCVSGFGREISPTEQGWSHHRIGCGHIGNYHWRNSHRFNSCCDNYFIYAFVILRLKKLQINLKVSKVTELVTTLYVLSYQNAKNLAKLITELIMLVFKIIISIDDQKIIKIKKAKIMLTFGVRVYEMLKNNGKVYFLLLVLFKQNDLHC